MNRVTHYHLWSDTDIAFLMAMVAFGTWVGLIAAAVVR